jgi:ElaA protein
MADGWLGNAAPAPRSARVAANVSRVKETIRVATFDELDARTLYGILQLRSDVFVVEQACAYADLDGRDLEPQTKHIWITDDGGAVLAYLRVLDEDTARIGRVAVAVGARRQGHAQRLLEKALEIIGERPAALSAQSYATKLYENAGFAIVGEEFDEDGIPHVPMRRR